VLDVWHACVLGIVEGLTEFIPVSSTGHLIVVGHLLGFDGVKASTFEIFIQLGAILAVVFLYKERFLSLCTLGMEEGFRGPKGIMLLGLTTLPALIFGAAAHSFIKAYLFNPFTVALGLGVGGVGIVIMEWCLPRAHKSGIDALTWKDALAVGLFQCLSLWPGISRSAATILGGMSMRLARETAAQYSFLAAVPVMVAATVFDLYQSLPFLHGSDIPMFGIGFVVSFIAAWLAVKGFLRFLGGHTLSVFGWYRIVVALGILWLLD
jgi:undecaprenyl-diphosphatase